MKYQFFLAIILSSYLGATGAYGGQSTCLSMAKSPVSGTALLFMKAEMESKIDVCANSPIFHFNYGHLLERLTKYRRAIIHYRKAIDLDPQVANYYIGLADVLRSVGEQKKAIIYYKKGLALDRDNIRALRQLEKCQIMLAGMQPITTASFTPPRVPKPVAVIAKPAKMPPTIDATSMCRYNTFFIDRYEVSVNVYKQTNKTYKTPEGFKGNMPVVNISYDEARAFAKAQGKRLCSAEEWLQVMADKKVDLKAMNLHKDYYSTPYSIDFGQEQREVKNLIGNVAEWVSSDAKPGFIGGHYASDLLLQNKYSALSTVISSEGLQGKPYVGLRLCKDID